MLIIPGWLRPGPFWCVGLLVRGFHLIAICLLHLLFLAVLGFAAARVLPRLSPSFLALLLGRNSTVCT